MAKHPGVTISFMNPVYDDIRAARDILSRPPRNHRRSLELWQSNKVEIIAQESHINRGGIYKSD